MHGGNVGECIAIDANWAKFRAARPWRPLGDTAVAAPYLYVGSIDWESRGRSIDFYGDGALLWLEVDTIIRTESAGKKSLDDFCKAFYGGVDGQPEVKPYALDDLISTLNAIMPYDWRDFFEHG